MNLNMLENITHIYIVVATAVHMYNWPLQPFQSGASHTTRVVCV